MSLSLNKQILIAAVLGIIFGFCVVLIGPYTALGSNILYFCSLIGGIFINLLKMILIPLVFTSITVGIANLRAHAKMDKVWKYTLIYYLTTTALAIILGLLLVNVFQPGEGLEIAMFQEVMEESSIVENVSIGQFIHKFLSSLFINPFDAMADGAILPTIIFAMFLGIALLTHGDQRAKTILSMFNELFELIMLMVNWIMKLLPLGVMVLLIKLVATQQGSIFVALAKFIFVVIGATLVHGFITLPLILKFFSKVDFKTYYSGVHDALITAFSTSSSAATLPVTYRCVHSNLKVNKDIAGFVLPLGATINMDGTALYEAVAALFVANLVGIDLNIVQQFIVFLMAMIASIGAPGIPSAGMVTMVMVLQAVGLPAEAIAILLPIDRILDAVRTMVNVKGDTIGSIVVDRFTSK